MTTRILIRSGRPPHQPVRIEAAHAYRGVGTFSTNSGNLLFQDAIYRTLRVPEADLVVDSLSTERRGMDEGHIARIDDEFDVVVLPLANAFREDFLAPLTRLTEVIEKLRLPVVVPCVGGQVGLDGDPGSAGQQIDEAAARFVRAVLERSESIGVRGELTKAYLESLGFPGERLDIVGCPSLHFYDDGESVRWTKRQLTPEARLAVNLTPSVPRSRDFLEHNHARYPRLTYLPQDNDAVGMLLWGEEFEAPAGMPASLDHYLCREGKIRFFADPMPWIDFLATQDFACGTRIHGNVAALLAGTPAFQLAHDSRTLELAQFHRIPHLALSDGDGTLDAAELYERADPTEFNAVRDANRDLWWAFLDRNGLAYRRRPDPEYDAEVAAATASRGVPPLTSAEPADLASRLRWLRQGLRPGDDLRTHDAYQPEFLPQGARQRDVLARLAELRGVVSDQAKLIGEQNRQLDLLAKQVERHRTRLADLKPPLSFRLRRRLRRMFAPSKAAG